MEWKRDQFILYINIEHCDCNNNNNNSKYEHNSLFRLLFCPDLTIAILSWQVFPASFIKPLQLIQNAARKINL